MFRTESNEPKRDERSREERSSDEVKASLLTFAVFCALIRFVPIIIRKIAS